MKMQNVECGWGNPKSNVRNALGAVAFENFDVVGGPTYLRCMKVAIVDSGRYESYDNSTNLNCKGSRDLDIAWGTPQGHRVAPFCVPVFWQEMRCISAFSGFAGETEVFTEFAM